MIDIHSHLIFSVDDGSCSLEESLRMIEEAEKLKISTIVATPHFQDRVFKYDGVLENFELLLSKAANYNVDIRLGCEAFADEDIINYLKTKKKISFGNTKYLLMELPYNTNLEYCTRLVHKIAALNINTIIAHPERNRKIIRDFNGFVRLVKSANCRIQVDTGSIAGIYGRYIKEATKQLLKIKAVDFVASNAHCSQDYTVLYTYAVSKIRQLCDEEYANKLLEANAYETIKEGSSNIYGREIS